MGLTRRAAPRMLFAGVLIALLSGCELFNAARLEVTPVQFEFPSGTPVREFTVRNSGAEGSLLRWRFDGPSALTADPASGTLPAGESARVTLTANRSGLTHPVLLVARVATSGASVALEAIVDPFTHSPPAPCDADPVVRYAGISPWPIAQAAASFTAAGVRPTGVLVGWHDEAAAAAAAAGRGAMVAAGLVSTSVANLVTDVRPIAAGVRVGATDPVALATVLERDPRVRWVELDGPIIRPAAVPDDPFYRAGEQWWLDAFGFAEGRVATGASPAQDVVVAVIDTGVRATHEELATVLLPGRSFAGYTSGTPSVPEVPDMDGHGTHVTGLIAAAEDNGLGIVGLASHAGVRILPVKVFDGPSATVADLVAALRWTAGLPPTGDADDVPPPPQRADVVNLSLGTPVSFYALRMAVIDARCEGVVLVGAAGNGVNLEGVNGGVDYPAAYPEVIAVGSVDEDQRRSTFSDYGEGLVDLMAPGGGARPARGICGGSGLLSTDSGADDAYACLRGTSMATPLVAAAAAALIAGDPDTYRGDQDATEAALRAAAARNPGPNSAEYGYGTLCLDALTTTTSVCGVPVGP